MLFIMLSVTFQRNQQGYRNSFKKGQFGIGFLLYLLSSTNELQN